MKASNYFATRMANSERVQQRLHEIADTMRLSSQLPANGDIDDTHSLLSNQAALDTAQCSKTSRRRSNGSSVQVVGMTILDRQEQEADEAIAIKQTQNSLHAETKKTKRRTSSIKRDAVMENDTLALAAAAAEAASPASSPTNSSKSSVRLQLPVNRPRLLSTTSLRSLSSSQVSSSNASSSQSSNHKTTGSGINARHHEQLQNNSPLQRLYRYLCLLPTLLSMLTMTLVTIVSLARTLVWSVWTPWTFVRLVSVWTLGAAVIHYNQLFWHTRKQVIVPELHNNVGAVAVAASSDTATSQVIAPAARRPSTKSKQHQRGNLQRMASSTSMRSNSTNKSASSVNEKRKTGSWKFWKRKPKSKSVAVTP